MSVEEREISKIMDAVEPDKGYTIAELLAVFRGSFSRPTLRKYLLAMESRGSVKVLRMGRGGAHYYSFLPN